MPKDNQTFDLNEKKEPIENNKVDLTLSTLMKELELEDDNFEVPKEITKVSKFGYVRLTFKILLTKNVLLQKIIQNLWKL